MESFDRRANTLWYVKEHFNLTENDASLQPQGPVVAAFLQQSLALARGANGGEVEANCRTR